MSAIAVIYRDANLIAIAGTIADAESWVSTVTISWMDGAARQIVNLNVSGVFVTAAEAMWQAELIGRDHVDARIKSQVH